MSFSGGPSITGRYVLLVVLLAGLVAAFAMPAREWFWQQSQIAQLEERIAEYQGSLAELDAAEERWRNPLYVAAQVRTRLNYVKPGEVGYVVLDEKEAPAPQTPGSQIKPKEPPAWWSTVWSSVEAASNPAPTPSPKAPSGG